MTRNKDKAESDNLFADDAANMTHTEATLQSLINCFFLEHVTSLFSQKTNLNTSVILVQAQPHQ